MQKPKSHLMSKFVEPLESRTLLSAAPLADPAIHAAIHADAKVVKETTKTTLKVAAGALGQAITFTVTVKTAAQFGSPIGTVEIASGGTTLQETTLAPITSPSAKFDVSQATYTMPGGAGGAAFYIGRHAATATFTSSGSLLTSTGKSFIVVKTPKYVKQSDGLKIATVGTGSGTGIAAGQTATMMYTGYLAKGGSIFDDSSDHSPGTFNFTVDASPEQVISGFDQGTLGMETGETRVLYIPYKLGYGTQGAGSSIPPKANLVFLITLVAKS